MFVGPAVIIAFGSCAGDEFNLAIIQLIQGNRAEAAGYYKKLQPLNRGLALELQRLLQLTKPGR